jgi:hypothetical protein
MLSGILRGIVEPIETEVRSRPSAAEFEMAYQARVAIDRIKFAIRHTEQFARPCDTMREASLQLLDALERWKRSTAAFKCGLEWPLPPERKGGGGEGMNQDLLRNRFNHQGLPTQPVGSSDFEVRTIL